MPGPIGDIERQLGIELMQANIETKRADTVHKRRFTDWEPWKVIALVAGAAAAVFSVIGGAIGWLLRGAGGH